MTALAERDDPGLALIVELEAAGAVTPVSLDLDGAVTFDRWEAVGRLFGRLKRSTSWWVGDWLNFGEHSYGDKYLQAASMTGLDEGTLMNYAYVAAHVPKSRRRTTLPFSVHALVAPMTPEDQTRWLDAAEREGWKRTDLYAAIRDEKAAGGSTSERDDLTRSETLAEAARAVWNQGRKQPGGDYLVPAEAMARLGSAIGVE